jgi:uncharacterized protein
METEQCLRFYSDGLSLDASFYPPTDPSPNKPVIMTCSGFQGLKTIHPARFARAFTARGYACFGFDYRGYGASEGEPGTVDEFIRDIANALSFLSIHPAARDRRIVLMGWGMGAGMILEASRVAPCAAALVAMNGFYDTERIQRHLRGHRNWFEFRDWLEQERSRVTVSPECRDLDPFEVYPLDPVTREYVDGVLRLSDGFGVPVKLGFATSLLLFAPEKRLAHLDAIPILIAHGDQNELHPPGEARSLYDRYPGPKTLHWIAGGGHTEWMLDEHPTFQALVEKIDEWLSGLSWGSR